MVEVAVSHEEVAQVLQQDAGSLQLTQEDGAAGGVEEHRLSSGQGNGEARLRPISVERVAGVQEDHAPHAAPSLMF